VSNEQQQRAKLRVFMWHDTKGTLHKLAAPDGMNGKKTQKIASMAAHRQQVSKDDSSYGVI
jgi:hypothetical protein